MVKVAAMLKGLRKMQPPLSIECGPAHDWTKTFLIRDESGGSRESRVDEREIAIFLTESRAFLRRCAELEALVFYAWQRLYLLGAVIR